MAAGSASDDVSNVDEHRCRSSTMRMRCCNRGPGAPSWSRTMGSSRDKAARLATIAAASIAAPSRHFPAPAATTFPSTNAEATPSSTSTLYTAKPGPSPLPASRMRLTTRATCAGSKSRCAARPPYSPRLAVFALVSAKAAVR